MPFVLITAGVVLFITALNGTYGALGSQLYKDLFTNSPSFLYWVLALLVTGFIGYIPGAKKPADAFMALIIVAMVLKHGGLFNSISTALQKAPTATAAADPLQAVPVSSGATSAATAAPSSSAGGVLQQGVSYLNDVKSAASQTQSALSAIGIHI